MPVREDEPFVDPRAAGQRRGVELAGRQHHLAHATVDVVAVVVHRDEVVVRPDDLQLAEGLQQRLMIPEPDVVDGLPIALDIRAGEFGVATQLTIVDAVERERLARGQDVVLDVGSLADLLVGRDDEALDEGGIQAAAEQHDGVEAGRAGQAPGDATEGVANRQQHSQQRRGGECERRRHARMNIGVTTALNDPGRREQLARLIQPGAEREDEEQRRREPRAMPADAWRHAQPERRQRELAGKNVDAGGTGGREQDERERQAACEIEHRHREDVERHVVAENRIRGRKIRPMPPREDRQPFRRGKDGDQAGGHRRGQHGQRAQLIACRQNDREPLTSREGRRGSAGGVERVAEIRGEPQKRDDKDARANQRFGRERGHKDRLVTDFAEPEPVRKERRHGRQDEEDDG